jgi:hypothetical protein
MTTNILDIFEALDDRHIVVTVTLDGNQWYFYDSDETGDMLSRPANGQLYKESEEAAEAAWKHYDLG